MSIKGHELSHEWSRRIGHSHAITMGLCDELGPVDGIDFWSTTVATRVPHTAASLMGVSHCGAGCGAHTCSTVCCGGERRCRGGGCGSCEDYEDSSAASGRDGRGARGEMPSPERAASAPEGGIHPHLSLTALLTPFSPSPPQHTRVAIFILHHTLNY